MMVQEKYLLKINGLTTIIKKESRSSLILQQVKITQTLLSHSTFSFLPFSSLYL